MCNKEVQSIFLGRCHHKSTLFFDASDIVVTVAVIVECTFFNKAIEFSFEFIQIRLHFILLCSCHAQTHTHLFLYEPYTPVY